MSDQRNSRNDHHILFTGDFWHTDFQSIISSIDVPITLVPLEKSASVVDQKFDLIVIAQSRRDQFSSAEVEKIQTTFSNTPIVSLLGSWCEGETRSGTPYPGLIRVYWHQWQGRYQKFVSQLADANLTDWHAPATSSIADRISQGPFTQLSTIKIFYATGKHWDQRLDGYCTRDACRRSGPMRMEKPLGRTRHSRCGPAFGNRDRCGFMDDSC